MIGTKAKRTNDKINNGTVSLINNSVLTIEITIIIVIARSVKIRCFVKKKQKSLFNLSPANDEVDEKEKKIPRKKRIKKLIKIFLSILLQ